MLVAINQFLNVRLIAALPDHRREVLHDWHDHLLEQDRTPLLGGTDECGGYFLELLGCPEKSNNPEQRPQSVTIPGTVLNCTIVVKMTFSIS
jgi:hypothetical protein